MPGNEILVSALAQAPFVAVIALLALRVLGYLEERDDEWRAYMQTRDEQMHRHFDELTESVRELSNTLITHDALVRASLREQPEPVRARRERERAV